ncbi:hypothetical protein ATM97_24025 [Nocardia sp. MH4]|nr:hypothetical protein [Nocardia sp. MH4]
MHVGVGRVGHRDEIDHHPIPVGELETAVEVQVDGELGALQQGGDRGGVEIRRAGEVDADPHDRDGRAESGRVAAPGEASATAWIGDRLHAAVRLTGTEVVAGGT